MRGYSKVHHHSYKKTSRNFYLNSVVLLRKALVNYSRGEQVVLEKLGKNYRLPSNFTVFKFFCKTIFRGLPGYRTGRFSKKMECRCASLQRYSFVARIVRLSRKDSEGGEGVYFLRRSFL